MSLVVLYIFILKIYILYCFSFYVTDAPDNTTVSEEVVYVQEETIPGRVICKSRANPGKGNILYYIQTYSIFYFIYFGCLYYSCLRL